MKRLMIAFMALSFLTATVSVSFADEGTPKKTGKKGKKKTTAPSAIR